MLSLIIPEPNCVIGEAFDVYLQPLEEELKQLWEVKVPTQDATQFNGDVHFNMHAILLWTMHDLLAYGTVVGCAVKGYQGCPICGPNTVTQRSRALRKNVYCAQHKKWL
jgi:hypothetical protein